jgi:hypothetical protein
VLSFEGKKRKERLRESTKNKKIISPSVLVQD